MKTEIACKGIFGTLAVITLTLNVYAFTFGIIEFVKYIT